MVKSKNLAQKTKGEWARPDERDGEWSGLAAWLDEQRSNEAELVRLFGRGGKDGAKKN